MTAAGYKVGYTDFKINYPGTTVATDVQRMRQAGVDLIVSCMDVLGNINLARSVQQYGLKTSQLWLSGNDKSTLEANKSLMQGVYFDIQHVPVHRTDLRISRPQAVPGPDEEVRAQVRRGRGGDAGLGVRRAFRQGVKMAGNNLTQANVIAQTNKLTAFTANGLTTAGELGHRPHLAGAAVLRRLHPGQGRAVRAGLQQGKNVFNCFESASAKKGPVFPLPAGTPGPA